MPVPSDKRPTYNANIAGGSDDFNRLWETTQAAGDGFDPLPGGVYRCLLSDGRMSQAKTGTESYKLTFTVIAGPFANRKVWHDCYLTPRALPMSKRDLQKLGIHDPEQLRQPPPAGIIFEVRIALLTDENERSYNRVTGFQVVEDAPPAGTLDPDDEDDDEGVPF